jgi:hypothetical protein
LPLFGGALLIVFGGVQINQWKCKREAKRKDTCKAIIFRQTE